jgi:hypothetical protein
MPHIKRFWLIVGVVVIAGFLCTGVHVRQDLGWIDSISGSQKRQTVWQFGLSSSPAITESLLAARYRKLGLQWEPDWKNVKGTYLDIFGRNVGHAHGWPAPEIYSFALSPDLQRMYLAASSDDEVREFFRIMSSGSDAEKAAAVEAACNKALGE